MGSSISWYDPLRVALQGLLGRIPCVEEAVSKPTEWMEA